MDPTPPSPVHAGLDALAVGPRPAGVGRYARTLLLGLAKLADPSLELTVIARAGAAPALAAALPARAGLTGPGRLLSLGPARLLWEQAALPGLAASRRIDLVHGLMGAVPLACRVPRVVTIHDATFVTHRELHAPAKAAWFSVMLRRAGLAARLVVTDSAASRDAIAESLAIPYERIRVVPLAVDPAFSPPPPAEAARTAAALGIDGPFVLYAGVLEPRKNLPRLIAAMRIVAGRGHPHRLVLAGKPGWSMAPIEAAIRAAGPLVRRLGWVSDGELRHLMAAATVFAYLPVAEGFGLPVAEALACGAAVLTSDCSSLPEVAGPAALLVPPGDEEAIAHGLERLILDASLAATLRGRGPLRAAELSPLRLARATAAVWREALGRRGPAAPAC